MRFALHCILFLSMFYTASQVFRNWGCTQQLYTQPAYGTLVVLGICTCFCCFVIHFLLFTFFMQLRDGKEANEAYRSQVSFRLDKQSRCSSSEKYVEGNTMLPSRPITLGAIHINSKHRYISGVVNGKQTSLV